MVNAKVAMWAGTPVGYLIHDDDLTGQRALNAFCVCQPNIMGRGWLMTMKPRAVALGGDVQHSGANNVHS